MGDRKEHCESNSPFSCLCQLPPIHFPDVGQPCHKIGFPLSPLQLLELLRLLGSFYDPTTPRVWQTIQKRKDKDKRKKYYFIIDNYLYIPIPKGELGTPESIRLKAWFIEPWKAEELNAKLQCKDNYCIDVYGSQMPVPEYMRNSVTVELLNQLRQIYLQVRPDNYPNLNTEDKTNQRDLSNGK